jgi:3',5'-cyclic AMP phosphodiesterase CpdA
MRLITLCTTILCTSLLPAQSVVRGPYLQTPTDNSIIVMWRTDVNTGTTLWYGAHPDSLDQSIVVGENVQDHSVMLTGLAPYTSYFYAVGFEDSLITPPSEQYRFRTHPLPGIEQPTRVWAIGDFGKGNAGQIAVKQSYMAYPGAEDTDVWIWLGDNVYDDGTDSEYQSKVFGLSGFSDVFNWLPFYPTPGNHDYNEVWRESTFFGIPYSNIDLEDHEGPYYDIVDVPEQAEAGGVPSQLEVFYSFDHGNTHFLSLNSEVYDFLNTSDGIDRMKAWIEQDLLENDKLWTVAYFHQPPYSKGSHDSDGLLELVIKAMRERVVPLLEEFDIDLVVCGHSHVYERSHLIHGHYGNSGSFDPQTMLMDGNGGNLAEGEPYLKDVLPTTPDGTVYVVCGNSGSGNTDGSMDHPVMVSNINGEGVYGSYIMDIYKNRLDGRFLNSDGSIGDHFTILKTNMELVPQVDGAICVGDSILLSAAHSGGSDAVSYRWEPGNLADTNAVLFPEETTTYMLYATDALTGQVDSSTFTITVEELPTPVIVEIDGGLSVQAGFTYQWYLDGEAIAGATESMYVPLDLGVYTVELINGACSTLSEEYLYITTGIASRSSLGIRVYPSPTDDVLTVELDALQGVAKLRLVDASGKAALVHTLSAERSTVDLSALSSGSYLLLVRSSTGQQWTSTVVKR